MFGYSKVQELPALTETVTRAYFFLILFSFLPACFLFPHMAAPLFFLLLGLPCRHGLSSCGVCTRGGRQTRCSEKKVPRELRGAVKSRADADKPFFFLSS